MKKLLSKLTHAECRAGFVAGLMIVWLVSTILITGHAAESITGMGLMEQIHQALFCPW